MVEAIGAAALSFHELLASLPRGEFVLHSAHSAPRPILLGQYRRRRCDKRHPSFAWAISRTPEEGCDIGKVRSSKGMKKEDTFFLIGLESRLLGVRRSRTHVQRSGEASKVVDDRQQSSSRLLVLAAMAIWLL